MCREGAGARGPRRRTRACVRAGCWGNFALELASVRDLALSSAAPPEPVRAPVPATAMLRSKRPFSAVAARIYVPFALLAAALIFAPQGAVFWGLLAGAALWFALFPALTQGLLGSLEREVLAATPSTAPRLLERLRTERRVRWFAPHAWTALQEGRLHLVRGEGRAAAKALTEAVRLAGSMAEPPPAIVSAQAHALLIAEAPEQARDLLQSLVKRQALGPWEALHLAAAQLLAGKPRADEVRAQLDAAQAAIGAGPRVLATRALLEQRAGESEPALSALRGAEAGLEASPDKLAELLIERARRLLRPAVKASEKRARKLEARAAERKDGAKGMSAGAGAKGQAGRGGGKKAAGRVAEAAGGLAETAGTSSVSAGAGSVSAGAASSEASGPGAVSVSAASVSVSAGASSSRAIAPGAGSVSAASVSAGAKASGAGASGASTGASSATGQPLGGVMLAMPAGTDADEAEASGSDEREDARPRGKRNVRREERRAARRAAKAERRATQRTSSGATRTVARPVGTAVPRDRSEGAGEKAAGGARPAVAAALKDRATEKAAVVAVAAAPKDAAGAVVAAAPKDRAEGPAGAVVVAAAKVESAVSKDGVEPMTPAAGTAGMGSLAASEPARPAVRAVESGAEGSISGIGGAVREDRFEGTSAAPTIAAATTPGSPQLGSAAPAPTSPAATTPGPQLGSVAPAPTTPAATTPGSPGPQLGSSLPVSPRATGTGPVAPAPPTGAALFGHLGGPPTPGSKPGAPGGSLGGMPQGPRLGSSGPVPAAPGRPPSLSVPAPSLKSPVPPVMPTGPRDRSTSPGVPAVTGLAGAPTMPSLAGTSRPVSSQPTLPTAAKSGPAVGTIATAPGTMSTPAVIGSGPALAGGPAGPAMPSIPRIPSLGPAGSGPIVSTPGAGPTIPTVPVIPPIGPVGSAPMIPTIPSAPTIGPMAAAPVIPAAPSALPPATAAIGLPSAVPPATAAASGLPSAAPGMPAADDAEWDSVFDALDEASGPKPL